MPHDLKRLNYLLCAFSVIPLIPHTKPWLWTLLSLETTLVSTSPRFDPALPPQILPLQTGHLNTSSVTKNKRAGIRCFVWLTNNSATDRLPHAELPASPVSTYLRHHSLLCFRHLLLLPFASEVSRRERSGSAACFQILRYATRRTIRDQRG